MTEVVLGPQIWRPSWIKNGAVPAFGWRVPTVTERELFEGEMATYNALAVYPWDIATAFREGLEALLPDNPEDVERIDAIREKQLLVEIAGQKKGGADKLSAAESAQIAEATSALMRYWPPYRELVGQAAAREAIMPIVAFRRFVTGWENVLDADGAEPVLRRGLDGLITEASISGIDSMLIRGCGAAIYRGMYPGGLEKNSAPPSTSGNTPVTSTKPTRKGGKSAKTSGEKTPA